MRLTKLSVSNYKSLRDISISPGPLTVIVGANASGKSNLADFYDFLSDLYKHGLSVAVARKGGYENIAYRKMRRSRSAIAVALTIEIPKEFSRMPRRPRIYYEDDLSDLRFSHSFSFKTQSQAIKSEFKIESERITLERKVDDEWQLAAEAHLIDGKFGYHVDNTNSESAASNATNLNALSVRDSDRFLGQFRILKNLDEIFSDYESRGRSELIFSTIDRLIPIFRRISTSLAAIKVFQLSTTTTREFGVPIPNPEMDRHGGNLPAVVDMLMKNHLPVWKKILGVMTQLLPGLTKIEVDYTHSRTLGLFFFEQGVGRPWSVSEISDGTIHSLALLVALHDPRCMMLVLEEPENSIHTWILRLLMDAAKEGSEKKQILLTTHSKVVVDAVSPKDVWVMWRANSESHIAILSSLDPDVLNLVDNGDLTTFELLDTGLILEALPPHMDEN